MSLKTENRQLVIPGDQLADGEYLLGEGTYRDGNGVYSCVLGLVDAKENFIKVIPIKEKYTPKPGDLVIGVITDISYSSWSININSHYSGTLNVANATERYIDLNSESLADLYGIGDVILAKVDNTSLNLVAALTMKDRGLYKLNEGKLLDINPAKVPRVIGKKGTMVQMLKTMTGCRIVVGQNGRIWVCGTNTQLAVEAIRMIEQNAHKQGLTDEISAFLTKKAGKQITAPAVPAAAKPAPAVPTQAPAAPAQAPVASKPVPVVKKVAEAMLPKMKGSEKPEKKVDDMEVF